MIFARFATLPLIAAAFLVGAGAFNARAAEADRVDARIEIFGFAGLHVLTNRTSVEEAANRYAIAMDLDTRGLAAVFVDLTSHSEVHGGLAEDTLRPVAYRAEVERNGVDRHYGLDYRGDGTVIDESTPVSAVGPLLVAAEQVRGTVDQLTAYFLLERQLARRGTCALVVPVSMAPRSTTFASPTLCGKCWARTAIRTSPAQLKSARSSAKRSWPVETIMRIPTGGAGSGMPG